jgi:hypothetical protein
MSAPGVSTFDLDTPRRPELDDLGGAQKLDDAEFPPDPETMPCAAEYNTFAHLLRAYGRALASVVLSIEGGAAPFVAGLRAPGTRIVPATFVVNRNAPGDVTITWPPRTLPASLTAPSATINEDGAFTIAAFAVPNGVRVKTHEGGTPKDAAFTVEIG